MVSGCSECRSGVGRTKQKMTSCQYLRQFLNSSPCHMHLPFLLNDKLFLISVALAKFFLSLASIPTCLPSSSRFYHLIRLCPVSTYQKLFLTLSCSIMKQIKLSLWGPSLTWVPSKPLGGTMEILLCGHVS